MGLTPGARLGPYEIRGPLGAGGMGEVYRAKDTRLGRSVAIKIVAEHRLARGDAAARFEREWRAVAALSHPNVVALYDVGNEGDISYAVMELLEGESLDQLLSKEVLPWRRALEIGAGIANGLAAAHEKGIVHRDLKPANVFITRDGVKVLDFGLAREGAAASSMGSSLQTATVETVRPGTEPGTVMGTVGYMAPEQVRGAVADQRSDIFALGCILYEMLTGSRAFRGHSSAEILASILRDQPNDVTDSGRRIPLGIDPIVRRCLEKQPDQRFQSARDLAFALTARLALSDATTQTIDSLPPLRPRWVWPSLAAAALVVAAVVVTWKLGWIPLAAKGNRISSLAVLPLMNRSGSPDQEYLADGVTEQLITNLGKIDGVRVISRTSSMSYKGTRKPLPQIARELGVDAVVEGSIARDGSRLKVTTELVDGKTEARLWQDSFDRDLGDALSLQSEIAEQVARSIVVELSPDQRARLQSARRIAPEAFDAYMRGRYYWNKRTRPDLEQSITEFRRAIDVAPTYAAAYAGLADTYALLAYQNYLPPSDGFPKARAAATRASELDATLASAYASLGYVNLYYDWDFTSAETNFKHAIALDGQLVTAHHYYSILLAALLRHDEARAEIERAHNLDPLSIAVATDMGFELYYARQYPEATTSLKEAIAANPNGPLAHFWLGRVYQAQGRFDDALKEFAATGIGSGGWAPGLAGIGHLQGVAGHRDEARKVIEQLEAQSREHYVSPYGTALVYLGLRDWPHTRLWLTRALDERANWAVWLLRDPRWDPLRGDPEFEKLVDRVGFPADARARARTSGPAT